MLFDLGSQRPGDIELVQKKVLEAAPGILEAVTAAQPVVVLDGTLCPSQELSAIENAVRVQPDDWPSFASPAWMTIDAVREDATLLSLVVEDDRDRIPPTEDR